MSTPATHPHGNSSSSGSNPLSSPSSQPTEAIASSMSANFEELIKLGGYPGTQFARRFVTIGMANLLNLQTKIQKLNHTLSVENNADCFEELMDSLRRYNQALLEQRQILSLPKYNLREQKRKTATPQFQEFLDFFSKTGLMVPSDLVSLDPCTCTEVCSPKGLGWVLNLPKWQDYEDRDERGVNLKELKGIFADVIEGPKRLRRLLAFARDWILKLLLVGFLAMLPAASILVLYMIPTPHQRLWTILGESAFLVLAVAVSQVMKKEDVLTYMLSLAAIQVVFVGSIIGSG